MYLRNKNTGEIKHYKKLYEYYHTLVRDIVTGGLYALYADPCDKSYHELDEWEVYELPMSEG